MFYARIHTSYIFVVYFIWEKDLIPLVHFCFIFKDESVEFVYLFILNYFVKFFCLKFCKDVVQLQTMYGQSY